MKKIFTLILICFSIAESILAQPDGTLDLLFNPGDIGFEYGTRAGGYALNLQPDGKILAFGYGGSRLKTNGDTDSTFTASSIFTVCTALQPDGKIVAGGYFNQFQTISRNHILRLESDGDLDTMFNPGSGFDGYVLGLALQTDGKILAVGPFYVYNGDSITSIARLNTDGSIDTSFHSGFGNYGYAQAITMQPDGKIIIGGAFNYYNGIAVGNIARLNTDGSLDTTFHQGTGIGTGGAQNLSALALQPDGKILAGGSFWSYNSVPVPYNLIRINSDGTRDTTFGNIGFQGGAVMTIALQADGKILAGGSFTMCDSVTSNCIARLDTNGIVDTTFNSGPGFNRVTKNIIVQPNGQIVVTGDFSFYNNFGRIFIVRINSDGSPDTAFFKGTGLNSEAWATALQADGKILVSGEFTSYNNTPYYSLARMLQDGSPDTAFHQYNTCLNFTQGSLIVQPDGKILLAGLLNCANTHNVGRINSDGSIDTTFAAPNASGASNAHIALQPDGKILSATGTKHLTRLNTDGSIDSLFYFNEGLGFNNTVSCIHLQPDGKIIVGGGFTLFDSDTCYRIARLNADGSFDSTFYTGTGFDFWSVNALAVQPDGKIIVAGRFQQFNGSYQRGIVRLNTDGSKDNSFAIGTGFSPSLSIQYSLVMQPDGKIIVGGDFSDYNGTFCNGIARLNSNGSYDSSFVSGTGCEAVFSMALQPDGKLIIAGSLTSYNGIGRNRIARLHAFNATGISETLSADNNILVFPNPAKKFIVISSEFITKNQYEINVTDSKGNLCFQTANYALPAIINISNLSNGIYFVTIDDGKEKAVKKFIKE